MKEFACGDLIPGCDARFCAATSEQVLADVARHARDDHGMSDIPAELVGQVRQLIRAA